MDEQHTKNPLRETPGDIANKLKELFLKKNMARGL
jgi:hypothetical protein